MLRADAGKSGGNFGVEQIHALVEASKIALEIRDRHITDPTYMAVHATTYIADPVLDRLARSIDAKAARGSSMVASPDEAVWIGVIDGHGRAVSVTQGLRTAWGSGVVVGEFGLLWHNSAIGFSLDESAANPLTPGRKPPQTLAPALARFKDGRVMPFGSSGGDTQPQTLAGLFGRYALFGENLQEAVSAPRWRLEPGQSHSKLWLESGIRADIEVGLARIGHSIALVEGIDSQMGQAGALLRHENGLLEGAFDPRSDGAVAAF